MEVESFVSRTLELLQEEREAEIEETRSWQENVSLKDLQRKGICLLKLQVDSQRTSLYGRLLVVFMPRKHLAASGLPSNCFGPGDIVGLYDSQGCGPSSQLGTGVVTQVKQVALSVAFESQDGFSLEGDALYNLMKLANNVTYDRQKRALNSLNGYSAGPASTLINVLFGYSEPGTLSQSNPMDFFNNGLDEIQREAVAFALTQREVAIIHGPPGTGKTTTVVEVILQAVNQGLKILCCAPSNVAVDHLVECLSRSKVKLLRLGHPARLQECIQKHSLDALLAHSDNTNIIADIRKDIDQAFAKMKKSNDKGGRSHLKAEVKELRRELRKREERAITQILKGADIVLATNTGASDDGPLRFLPKEHFDLVVIDECAQALESSCWISLLKARKCILAGDHKQLPPTIKSQTAAAKGLSLSLMERLIQKHGVTVVRMLTVQYRMNSAIMQWASQAMYGGKLTAHVSVEKHLLRDLPGVGSTEETETPLLLIDTAGCGLSEMEANDDQSKGNQGEAEIAALHIKALIEAGVKAKDIAVIAPYNLQVDLLRQQLSLKHPELEIKSVDGFQGREKEAVVLSLVRSNRKGEVGFLAEDRRINVAVTRAKRHLAVVCDSQTIQHHEFLRSLLDYMSEHGEVRTAFQYLENAVPLNYTHEPSQQHRKPKPNPSSTRKKESKEMEHKHALEKKGVVAQHKDGDALDLSIQRVEGERKNSYNELKEQLLQFLKDPERDVLPFPSSLNSHNRLLVHQISEELGLRHESVGEGNSRRITVCKATGGQQEANTDEPVQADSPTEHPVQSTSPTILTGHPVQSALPADPTEHPVQSLTPTGPTEPQSEAAPQRGPSGLLDLKNLHLVRMEREQAKRNVKAQCSSAPAPAHSSKNSKRAAKGKGCSKATSLEFALANTEDEDFDTLINDVMKVDSICASHKCKASVLTIGQLCPFCNRRYCLSHHIPEVHGCGDFAKAHARMGRSRDAALRVGSGKKVLDPNKKAHLQRKLDTKLKELSTQRKMKPKADVFRRPMRFCKHSSSAN
ncbi:hypothetical protein AAFF_G00089950 [Aldrovandia affinis]|uniref:DNA-binding protein SMUBP-2 n=1 Tax=Aldrovandia affinis TaxID=143900 RepID=A0AAD7WCC5_9TELE|nr:hypothetical protein AAFF_G00089950 [Aldrovandia affinis]